jgi:hypothetical protein
MTTPQVLHELERYIPNVGNRLLTLLEEDAAAQRVERQRSLDLDNKELDLEKMRIDNERRVITNRTVQITVTPIVLIVLFALACILFLMDKELYGAFIAAIPTLMLLFERLKAWQHNRAPRRVHRSSVVKSAAGPNRDFLDGPNQANTEVVLEINEENPTNPPSLDTSERH